MRLHPLCSDLPNPLVRPLGADSVVFTDSACMPDITNVSEKIAKFNQELTKLGSKTPEAVCANKVSPSEADKVQMTCDAEAVGELYHARGKPTASCGKTTSWGSPRTKSASRLRLAEPGLSVPLSK